jgi:hypothetical protein
MAALTCVIGLPAGVAAGAESEGAAAHPHVLVLAAEKLAERPLTAAAGIAVRVALATPGLSRADRARLDVVKVKLRVAAPAAPANAPPAAESQARALLRLVDTLYKELQYDGAGVALQLSARCAPLEAMDQAQLALRQGLLQMESFDDAGARRSFREALDLDRTARLPSFAPPKTARVLEEVRAALPPPQVVQAPASTKDPVDAPVAAPGPTGLRAWAWAPAAGGAALGVAGGALFLGAKSKYDLITSHDPSLATLDQVHSTADAGRALQSGAIALFGAGALALGSAAAMALLDGRSAAQVSVHVGPGAAGVAIVGVLP